MTAAPVAAGTRFADEPLRGHRHGWWWKTLLAGAALWVVTIVVTVATLNVNLVPTLILIGSFVVPFAVVLFAAERISTGYSVAHLVVAFFVGGVLGVLGASLLESHLTQNLFLYLGVGLIEELVKGVLLVVLGRSLVPKTARQGALLGAVIGAGFAAFESAGYAFNAAIGSGRGIDLVTLTETEAFRAVLTPLGHVLWTALLGAVLFGASRDGVRFAFRFRILGAYLLVSVLHALWDSMSGIATAVALVLSGDLGVYVRTGGVPRRDLAELHSLSELGYGVGLIVVSLIGGAVLAAVVRRHRDRDRAVSEAAAPAVPAEPV